MAPTDLDTLPVRAPRWQVQLDDARGLELVAHPPVIVAERIVVAGSRVGWVGLAFDGTVRWRHGASPRLAPPLVVGDALTLIDECGAPTAVDPGLTLLACATWIGAADGQVRRVAPVRAADASPCVVEPGAWRVESVSVDQASLARGVCRFALDLGAGPTAGLARRLPDVAPPPDDDPDLVYLDPARPPWARTFIVDRTMLINGAGDRILPGLTVLADDPGGTGHPPATIVRRDTSLRHDAVIADRWWWPLPDPGLQRGGPVAVASTPAGVVAFFDGDRVALFAP